MSSTLSEDQYKAILEQIERVNQKVDRLEGNWDLDRKDQTEVINRVGHLEVEVKTLSEIVRDLPKKTTDKMSGVVGQIKQEAQDLKDVVTDKKMLALNEVKKTKKRHWWLLWIR